MKMQKRYYSNAPLTPAQRMMREEEALRSAPTDEQLAQRRRDFPFGPPPLPPGFIPPGANFLLGFPAAFAKVDPVAGKGHRAGDRVRIPASSGRITVINFGHAANFGRWKIIVSVEEDTADPVPANTGAALRVFVTGRTENDNIVRTATIGMGNAQVFYTPGRSLQIEAQNSGTRALFINFSIDASEPGISDWYDRQALVAFAAETALNIPNFCLGFEVYAPVSGGPAITLNGYDDTGTLVFSQLLSQPQSGQIEVIPGVAYTLTPAAATTAHVIYYCEG